MRGQSIAWRAMERQDDSSDDGSLDRLISEDIEFAIKRDKNVNYQIKLALWAMAVLSCILAATGIVLLIAASTQPLPEGILADGTGEPSIVAMQPQQPRPESVRVAVSGRTARIIVERPSLPPLQLHVSHGCSSGEVACSEPSPAEWCEGAAGTEGWLQCMQWPGPHGARLTLSPLELPEAEGRTKCFNISLEASADRSTVLEACLSLEGKQLYGGPTMYRQRWPAQTVNPILDVPYLTGYDPVGSVAERFWLTSKGEALFIAPEVPMFISQNSTHLCVKSRVESPYRRRGPPVLHGVLCGAETTRHVFLSASRALLGKPSATPDARMMRHPVWSTWARFKKNITAKKVIDFARAINRYNFSNSQLEIDDNWEYCYGFSEFNNKTFPDAAGMVKTLHDMGFRVTVWMHPFENRECWSWVVASGLQLLVRRPGDNATDAVDWWDGNDAGLIDFTKPMAAQWFDSRAKFLQKNYQIDGFKFDGGDIIYVPELAVLDGPEELQPASYGTAYAETAASIIPGMAEVRTPFMSQRLPLVVRMFDKASSWDEENGLATLIPSLLTLNMVGYSTVMPDMIGGNGYSKPPTKELFIRWMQASLFMPVLQFSYAPWDFDNQTVKITKNHLDLRSKYDYVFAELAREKVLNGTPINPPIWWIAPHDSIAQTIDSEFLVGERLLVAPVLTKGARHRDVYLPQGTWREVQRPRSNPVRGPTWLRALSAPLDYLPLFEKVNTAEEHGQR